MRVGTEKLADARREFLHLRSGQRGGERLELGGGHFPLALDGAELLV
jgi:hypothetical protein